MTRVPVSRSLAFDAQIAELGLNEWQVDEVVRAIAFKAQMNDLPPSSRPIKVAVPAHATNPALPKHIWVDFSLEGGEVRLLAARVQPD